MQIKINHKDLVNIANNVKHGGGNYSELEVTLAKKCLKVTENLGRINNERNEMFECLYGIGIKLSKASFAGALAEKRKADLMRDSKQHYAAMIDAARKAESIKTKDEQDNADNQRIQGVHQTT